MSVHVRGPWLTSRVAARHWRSLAKAGLDSRGRIINTTWVPDLLAISARRILSDSQRAVVGLTLTLALELQRLGGSVNAIGPAGATRITGTMPNAPAVVEPDEIPETPPSVGSGREFSGGCLVGFRRGAVRNWTGHPGDRRHNPSHARLAEGASASNDGERWDASRIGEVMATRIFGTQGRGLQTWSN